MEFTVFFFFLQNGHTVYKMVVLFHGLPSRLLSPLLYIMCTNDCHCSYENRHIIKYVDVSLLQEQDRGHDEGCGVANFSFN